MRVSERLERYLARKGLTFEPMEIAPAATLPQAVAACGNPGRFAEAMVLIDVDGLVMAVHAADARPSLEVLRELTGRPLHQLEPIRAASYFDDCYPGFIPPVGAAWELEVLVDHDIFNADRVWFTSGSEQVLIQMDGAEFRRALGESRRADFGRTARASDPGAVRSPEQVSQRLKSVTRLPPIPLLASRISALAADPETHARELGDLVRIDPGLAAQVLRYARSGLFGPADEVNSLASAIGLLGSERLTHIVQGTLHVPSFTASRDGSLGINRLWRHSLYSAFLCRALAEHLGLDPEMAYLCGLLHNFGLFLTAWLYPSEFRELQALREIHPDMATLSLEHEVFGVTGRPGASGIGHAHVAGQLYRLWQLPEPVIRAAGLHQQSALDDIDDPYARTVYLANELLKQRGIGDEVCAVDIAPLARLMGLSDRVLDQVQQQIAHMAADLDALVNPFEH